MTPELSVVLTIRGSLEPTAVLPAPVRTSIITWQRGDSNPMGSPPRRTDGWQAKWGPTRDLAFGVYVNPVVEYVRLHRMELRSIGRRPGVASMVTFRALIVDECPYLKGFA